MLARHSESILWTDFRAKLPNFQKHDFAYCDCFQLNMHNDALLNDNMYYVFRLTWTDLIIK